MKESISVWKLLGAINVVKMVEDKLLKVELDTKGNPLPITYAYYDKVGNLI